MRSHLFKGKRGCRKLYFELLLEFLSVSSYLACIAVFYKALRLVLFLSFQLGFCCLSFYSQKLVAFFSFFSFTYIVEKKENSNTCIVRLQSHRRITAANPNASKVSYTKRIIPWKFLYFISTRVYLDFVSGKWQKGRIIHTVSSRKICRYLQYLPNIFRYEEDTRRIYPALYL